jgi:hypothetical protein
MAATAGAVDARTEPYARCAPADVPASDLGPAQRSSRLRADAIADVVPADRAAPGPPAAEAGKAVRAARQAAAGQVRLAQRL